jgi:hypothetical protein
MRYKGHLAQTITARRMRYKGNVAQTERKQKSMQGFGKETLIILKV